MHVVQLTAENFRGLKAIDITPPEHLVTIAGRNGAGKSSVLNALFSALAGGAASRELPHPVRDGQDTAEVTVDLGDLRVTRTWTNGGDVTRLKVVLADGSKPSSPQAVLDRMLGTFTFDPLAFTRLTPRDQVTRLLEVVDLPFDMDDVNRRRTDLFARRTDVNREVRRLEGQLENTPKPADDLPEREVSVSDLAAQLRAANAAHRALTDATQRIARISDHAARAGEDLNRARQQVAALEAKVEALRVEFKEAHEDHLSLEQDLPDVQGIESQLAAADSTNRAVRARDEYVTLVELLAEQAGEAARLTDRIREADEAKAKALADADMPLPGLAIVDDGPAPQVTLQGIPLQSCSSAEQLKASIAIAMALNPRLRVIRVTDGSLLDEDSLAMVADMAAAHGYQIWCETVDTSGEVGIVIEAGEVVAVNS